MLCTHVTAPPRPQPPVIGRVTHYSVELSWETALLAANDVINKGDGRVQVTLHEQKSGKAWSKAYSLVTLHFNQSINQIIIVYMH
jgi:hypothetical protein